MTNSRYSTPMPSNQTYINYLQKFTLNAFIWISEPSNITIKLCIIKLIHRSVFLCVITLTISNHTSHVHSESLSDKLVPLSHFDVIRYSVCKEGIFMRHATKHIPVRTIFENNFGIPYMLLLYIEFTFLYYWFAFIITCLLSRWRLWGGTNVQINVSMHKQHNPRMIHLCSCH